MSQVSPWGVESLDVAAYLRRIDVSGPLPASADTLRRLHRAHVSHIPFENIDIPLGRGIEIDLDSLQAKLVRSRRGGYCYEHNLLFSALLERLGYGVVRLGARVLMGIDAITAKTHVSLRVTALGADYFADVGFGPDTLVEPLPYEDGAEAEQDGWTYRLRADGTDWLLTRYQDGDWFPLYRAGPERLNPIDYVVGNHYVSTHPRSPFTGRVFAGRALPDQRLTLNGRTLTRKRPDGTSQVTEVPDGDLRRVLGEEFGIALSEADVHVLLRSIPATSE